jgi:predicted DNA-binding protein
MKAKYEGKIIVRVPLEMQKALMQHQETTGVPLSVFVRRAIEAALKKKESGQ